MMVTTIVAYVVLVDNQTDSLHHFLKKNEKCSAMSSIAISEKSLTMS